MINKLVCNFAIAESLEKFDIPLKIFDGSFIYDKETELLYVVLDIANKEITAAPVLSEIIKLKKFKDKEFYKAYTASEIGELLPNDYTLPIKNKKGHWLWLNNEGNFFLYDTFEFEAQSRAVFLWFLLENKQLKVEDLIYV